MELPQPGPHTRRNIKRIAVVVCALLAVLFLWRAATWQNPIRAVMGLEPVDSAHPFKVCVIAVSTFLILLALARGFRFVFNSAAKWIHRFVPRRISIVLGAVVAVL